MPGYADQDEAGAFDASRELFEQVVAGLADPEAGRLRHDQLEERLQVEGRELLRSLMQDHLDLRAVREERLPEVTGADHVPRTRVEQGHRRGLATVFGRSPWSGWPTVPLGRGICIRPMRC